MKLNNFFRYCLLLACGLFISCQNVERNDKRLDNTSHKVLGKIKYTKELDDYLEKNRNKRYTDVNDRSYKSLKNPRSDQELLNQNYKSSMEPNNIREVKILKKEDYYLPNKNKNENFIPKTILESYLEDKEYENTKSSKHFNKNHPSNKIKRELPEKYECMGRTETKKRMSSADKFLSLDKKERERLLEKVLKEINRKLNRPEPGNGNDEDKPVGVKPQLLILNSKSKPKRDENSETDSSIGKAVENAYSSKTYQSTPSGFFNGATETVISPDLKTNPGISSIGKQTGTNNVNTEELTNSKNFSKRENTQYQKDGEHLTSFMPGDTQQNPSVKDQMEMRRVQENKPEVNNNDEITTDQSGKTLKARNKDGQPQLYEILKSPLETNNKFGQNEGSSDSPNMSERANKDYGEDDELMEYVKNNVKNCLQEMRKDVKEEKVKPEVKEENHREETTSDIKENYPKETSPQVKEQPSLFDKLNNLDPNSPGFQLLRNILQSTPSKPNILLGENQKAHGDNVSPYKSPLIAEENYLDEVSSEENGNDLYDVILQNELENLYEFAPTYIKPNMETTRFDRLWATDLLDELFFL